MSGVTGTGAPPDTPPDSEREQSPPPAPGTLVRNLATNRVGRIMDGPWGTRVALRPPSGGTEWDAELDRLEPATTLDL
ncbi:hypothetical protein ABZY03_33680 [Streptomyces klenkii]|uniref:hypothetical protein n=1 Tax=Streptomyces klenkii TaxID=1420899 RepID=UPI0033A514E5